MKEGVCASVEMLDGVDTCKRLQYAKSEPMVSRDVNDVYEESNQRLVTAL